MVMRESCLEGNYQTMRSGKYLQSFSGKRHLSCSSNSIFHYCEQGKLHSILHLLYRCAFSQLNRWTSDKTKLSVWIHFIRLKRENVFAMIQVDNSLGKDRTFVTIVILASHLPSLSLSGSMSLRRKNTGYILFNIIMNKQFLWKFTGFTSFSFSFY